jgi:DNA-binding PadR family transcriptional regulator
VSGPIITHTNLRIMRLFLAQQPKKLACYSIARTLGADQNTIWIALKKLEQHGWLTSEKERVNPEQVGRMPRKLYSMTPVGEKTAMFELKLLQLPPHLQTPLEGRP